MICRLAILFISAAATFAMAAEITTIEPASLPAPDQAMAPVEPVIEKLDDTRYRIGKVTFDQKSREIRFPAKVNMTDGLLEFLIVHINGKVHESLLVTEISPLHLKLAFTLLRYSESPELYYIMGEDGLLTDQFPDVPADIKAGARVIIDVEWKDGEKLRRLPVTDWIQHAVKTTAMSQGPWVYGGSHVIDGKYQPETSGDIVAIYLSYNSMVNNPADDNGNDDV